MKAFITLLLLLSTSISIHSSAPAQESMADNIPPKRHDTVKKRCQRVCELHQQLFCGDDSKGCVEIPVNVLVCPCFCPIIMALCSPCITGYVCCNSKCSKRELFLGFNHQDKFKDDPK